MKDAIMKLFTNEHNPATLKVVIASCLAGEDLTLEIVPVEDARFQLPRRLPVLQFPSGTRIFSANSAVRFFLPPSSLAVDEWLQLEATQIAPLLTQGAGKLAAVLPRLVEILVGAESVLSKSPFLCGTMPTAADVSLWSSLYPILSDKSVTTFGPKVSEWFARFGQDSRVSASLARVLPRPGNWSLANLSWIPTPETVKSSPDAAAPSTPVKEVVVTQEELKSAREIWEQGVDATHGKPAVKPVLPVPGERNVLITSALPYVNNVPHLGNIIGCVLSADVFARFCRLRNYNTLYICGTDEYGTATETKAIEEGLTPKEICDKYHAIHADIYRWFNIEFDHFGRTTTKQQETICQEMFLRLKEKELVFTEATEQLLCQQCDRFLADRFVEGTCPRCGFEDARGDQCDGCGGLMNAIELIAPRCKTCSARPVVRLSQQFYLDLPKIEPKLKVWLEQSSEGWSHNARVIAKAWLKDGLKPRCITRDLKWGIPVPLQEYADKVFYVWFDAPIGYISMTACYTDKWQQWWQPGTSGNVALYQFMAKDNVPFHSVMFPSTLIGMDQGHTVVSHIMATEYLNYEDGKFSKSRGVGVFGNDARETGIEADVWRFYLLFVRPEQQDSSFGWNDLATKVNCELLNNLGNFINRALMFAEKSFDGRVPAVALGEDDLALAALVNREVSGFVSALEKARLRDGLRHILSVSRLGNQLMQAKQPWVLLKGTANDIQKAGTVIGLCCNLCALLACMLHPFMPCVAARLSTQLNATPPSLTRPGLTRVLPEGHRLGKAAPLFTKIEAETIEKLKARFSGNQKSRSPEKTEIVSVEHLNLAVTKQAELVRGMKAGGAGKAEVAPHVATLLELKKQLALATGTSATPSAKPSATPSASAKPAPSATPSASTVAELETKVAAQAELVRGMKAGGAGKAEVAPHVATLLELKKQLALATGTSATPSAGTYKPAPSAKSKKKGKN